MNHAQGNGLTERATDVYGAGIDSSPLHSRPSHIRYEYNDFQQLIKEYQAHDGAVVTATTPKVEYAYADGSANTVRSVSIKYPNGRLITFVYDTGDDDALSRITAYEETV